MSWWVLPSRCTWSKIAAAQRTRAARAWRSNRRCGWRVLTARLPPGSPAPRPATLDGSQLQHRPLLQPPVPPLPCPHQRRQALASLDGSKYQVPEDFDYVEARRLFKGAWVACRCGGIAACWAVPPLA